MNEAIKRSEDIAKVEELIALGDGLQWSDELTTAGRLVVNALPALRRLCDSVPTEQPQIADTTNHKGAHDENDKHASKP